MKACHTAAPSTLKGSLLPFAARLQPFLPYRQIHDGVGLGAPLTFSESLSHSIVEKAFTPGLKRKASMPTMAISATMAAVSKLWNVLGPPLQAGAIHRCGIGRARAAA